MSGAAAFYCLPVFMVNKWTVTFIVYLCEARFSGLIFLVLNCMDEISLQSFYKMKEL